MHIQVFLVKSYVMDVPDLPLVLSLVDACENGQEPTEKIANGSRTLLSSPRDV